MITPARLRDSHQTSTCVSQWSHSLVRYSPTVRANRRDVARAPGPISGGAQTPPRTSEAPYKRASGGRGAQRLRDARPGCRPRRRGNLLIGYGPCIASTSRDWPLS